MDKVLFKRTKYGNFMYNLCLKSGIFLSRHKPLYYFLSFSWGIFPVIGGLVVTFIMLITGHKPKPYHGIWYFEAGKNWGGVIIGLTAIKCKNSTEFQICSHELGHSYQNAVLGPFAMFLVFFLSSTRYWFFRIRKVLKLRNKPYDLIWFEGNATDLGKQIVLNEDVKTHSLHNTDSNNR